MVDVSGIFDLIRTLLPSFSETRKSRNAIKTHYRRKVIRNIMRDEPVELFERDTSSLKKIEKDHIKLEARISNAGNRNKSLEGSRRALDQKANELYDIPDEQKKDIIKEAENIIRKIRIRNWFSILLEGIIYVAIAVFFLIMIAMITDFLSLL